MNRCSCTTAKDSWAKRVEKNEWFPRRRPKLILALGAHACIYIYIIYIIYYILYVIYYIYILYNIFILYIYILYTYIYIYMLYYIYILYVILYILYIIIYVYNNYVYNMCVCVEFPFQFVDTFPEIVRQIPKKPGAQIGFRHLLVRHGGIAGPNTTNTMLRLGVVRNPAPMGLI